MFIAVIVVCTVVPFFLMYAGSSEPSSSEKSYRTVTVAVPPAVQEYRLRPSVSSW